MSPHQVEGHNENNWTEWEKNNAEKLAKEAESSFGSLKIWDKISEKATSPQNYMSGEAINHKNRYKEDIQLAQDMGLNAFRFGIEWSRVEPKEGEFSEEAISYYRDYISEVRENGMEPIVTLWHFTNPKWFSEKGGWTNPENKDYFLRYVEKVIDEFGDKVTYWITLNEPLGFIFNAYIMGNWAPGRKAPYSAFKCLRNFLSVHKKTYAEIKRNHPDSMVATANNMTNFNAVNDLIPNKVIAKALRRIERGYLIEKTIEEQDFIGVNHYFKHDIDLLGRTSEEIKSDLGWSQSPQSLVRVVEEMSKWDKPILITEHGIADSNDEKRKSYLQESLSELENAENTEILGYLHWSLLDNFEWDKGFWPRFGLIEIDYENNLERNIRDSGKLYSQIIKKLN
ncbi:glycosyl hydrolase family 1 [Candidatus Nanohalobium constans]|uniref:Glycosyl hydrolase family 1 n=2 Tax=Candidatus Nanohalobium constans TaxID=2565781 RepID=A0A5Q0UIG5_9ARCH|nr:glycosyl hydrolase family 1 [Candidatus Nanohalobium constans]